MSEKKYYLVCDDDNRFEGMTKEQIIAAIAEATGYLPSGADAVITKIKESNANKALTFWLGTETEFNALGVTGNIARVKIDSNGKLYLLPGGKINGEEISNDAIATSHMKNAAVTRAKLAQDAKNQLLTATLLASGWGTSNGNYYQDLTINGVSTTQKAIFVDVDTSAYTAANVISQAIEIEEAWCSGVVKAYVRQENSYRVWFKEKPAIDIPIKLIVGVS